MFALVPAIVSADAELLKKIDDIRKPILREQQKKPAPLPAGLTGKVTMYKDGYVSLNIGIDAGLTNGAVLDVFREDKLLGTLIVERVYPKEAVASFKPVGGKKPGDLKADDKPQASDAVGVFKGKN